MEILNVYHEKSKLSVAIAIIDVPVLLWIVENEESVPWEPIS